MAVVVVIERGLIDKFMCNIAQVDLCILQRVFTHSNMECDTLFPSFCILLALFKTILEFSIRMYRGNYKAIK